MKICYLSFMKLFKGKKCFHDSKKNKYNKRYFNGGNTITEKRKKKKVNNHISYSIPAQKENEKYNFEVLMKTIKNRADEYNLIKIKETQNKILIHLNKFTINEVISTLILAHKYNMLNSKIIHEITEHLFRHSCFLNSKHLYILVSIIGKIDLDNLVFLPSQNDGKSREKNNNADVDDYLQDLNENIKWKKKYYKEILDNVVFPEKMCLPSNEKEMIHICNTDTQNEIFNQENIQIEQSGNGTNADSLTTFEISENQKKFSVKNFVLKEEDICPEMKKTYLKIKNIMSNNYNNIYMNIKKNMYTSLLLLNYLQEENIISRRIFLKIIYGINVEFCQHNICNDKSRENYKDHYHYNEIPTYAETILNSYIQDQCNNVSTYDLYIHVHFHLLQNVLTKCDFINKKFIMEKIQNGVSIDEEVYKDLKLYLEIFSIFFQNLRIVNETINYLKVFYLNVLSYEIFKPFCDNHVYKNVKIHYDFLKKVTCEYILKGKTTPSICYRFLGLLCYFERKKFLNSGMNPSHKTLIAGICNGMTLFEETPFGESSFDVQKMHRRYSLFLNSLKNYSLHDFFTSARASKKVKEINQDILMKPVPNVTQTKIEPTYESSETFQSLDELKKTFFSYFMVEFTFNIACYLNKIDTYEQLFILKYLTLLNLKNEYIIDILKEHQHNFFIRKLYYSQSKHFFYLLEYLFTLYVYSPYEFLNILLLIDPSKFQNVLDLIRKKKKFTNNVKKIFDAINVIINEKEHSSRKNVEKKKTLKSNLKNNSMALLHDTKQIQRFQNILYDFLFL
ncbi:hypothetical protein PGO_134570 [Plasmodium gonderi]|uniref:Uncharacterized protein n=1 Tax=Plasmodium gonderi TaxID=77519 RepID=A0A1Y1JP21_PLAGO|nr:hypothetical protein PGO_134570 [Plasmodium gonderi]GAW83185.1 hypothetical protein PGO_134570 [Plasmodium gonderi]